MKKKLSLVVPFILAFVATVLFLIDLVMDSSRLILAVIGVVLTIFWIAYALILRKFSEDGKIMLNEIAKEYEGKLNSNEWTEVYLKPSAHHQLGTYNIDEGGKKARFYAKIQPNTDTSIWSDRLPCILLAILKDEEWISEGTPIVKYGVKGFEEFFTLEE